MRNCRFDRDIGMRLGPKAQHGSKRLAKSEFCQSDRAQLFQDTAIELLKRIDLLENGATVLSQRIRVWLRHLRKPRQRARMRAKCKKIGPELVMKLARNLLAFQILQRNRTLGETPLILHGVTQGRRQMVQPGTNRSQFGRAARLDACVITSRTRYRS